MRDYTEAQLPGYLCCLLICPNSLSIVESGIRMGHLDSSHTGAECFLLVRRHALTSAGEPDMVTALRLWNSLLGSRRGFLGRDLLHRTLALRDQSIGQAHGVLVNAL